MRNRARTTSWLVLAAILAAAHHDAQAAKPAPVQTSVDRVHIGRDLGLDRGWLKAYRSIKRTMDAAGPNARFAYLSGPVSTGGSGSVKQNLARGQATADALRAQGLTVISPFELEAALRTQGAARPKLHASFMKIWSKVLADPRVERLVLTPGAESSVGATIEQGLFVRDGRRIQVASERRGKVTLTDVPVDRKLGRVEHTLLGTTTTGADVTREATWAGGHGVRAMVVRPEHVRAAAKALRGTRTVAAAVIGFPTEKFVGIAGAEGVAPGQGFAPVSTRAKIDDAIRAIDGAAKGGARVLELDMILDVHALKAGKLGEAQRDVESVIAAARAYGKRQGVATKVKVILETSLLTPREVELGTAIVRQTKALSVKTSTGYGARGASQRDLRAMRRIVGDTKLIKVSGGVTAATFADLEPLGDIFGMSKTRELAGETAANSAGY